MNVPVTAPVFEYAFPLKQERRREDDISIVASGMGIKVISAYEYSCLGLYHMFVLIMFYADLTFVLSLIDTHTLIYITLSTT